MNYGSRGTTADQRTFYFFFFFLVPSLDLNGTFHLKYCPAAREAHGENREMKISKSNQTGGLYSPGFKQLMFAHLGGTSRSQLQH